MPIKPTNWMPNYPPHLKNGLAYAPYETILDIADEVFSKYAHKDAFVMLDNNVSYSFVHRHSTQLATYFQDIGLQKGERVAIMMPNVLQLPISLIAAWRCGLVGVNINPLYTADEIARQLTNAGCKAIVVLDVFAHTLEKALSKIPSLQHIIVAKIGDHMGLFKGSVLNYLTKSVKKTIPAYKLPKDKTVTYTDALFIGSQNELIPTPVSGDDLALLQYTGGTTGVSKGVELTHANLSASVLNNKAWFAPALAPVTDDPNQQVTVLTVLPLYHILSLIVTLVCFAYGGKAVLIPNPRDFGSLIKTISRNKINVITAVNTLFNAFLCHPRSADLKLDHLLLVIAGGAPVNKKIAEKWLAKTKVPICEGYGLSECSPVLCCNTVHIPPKIGSVGFPAPNTEVVLLDADGSTITTANTPGELAAKGPQIMRRYWNNPTETAKVFTADGYFKTGDIAIFDEEGYFFIVDRLKDVILVGGLNVYPNEVEDTILQMPGVKECAVIGVAHEKSGERVKLFVVAQPDADLTEDMIRDYCRQHLTSYKQPSLIEFRQELPKSNVGKILRKQLRQEAGN